MARDDNSRLVYSTDTGPTQAPARGEGKAKARPGPKGPQAPGGVGIRLRLDRRASGRLVTVLTGFPGTEAELTALGRELKAACGAGGAIKDGAIELQGDHRDAIEATLGARGLKWKRSGG